jgi:hypothetical protein
MPLASRTAAPSMDKQNRRTLAQLEVLKSKPVVLKEWNGDALSSIDDKHKSDPAGDRTER